MTTRRFTFTNRSAIWCACATLVLTLAAPAQACPLCAETTEQQSDRMAQRANPALGYAISVIFMISVPFTLVGGFGYALYRNSRNALAHSDQIDAGTD